MYTARHSGWLGPSGYIHAYPKLKPKPTLRSRLVACRGYLAYAVFLVLVPPISSLAVNLYASNLVVSEQELLAVPRIEPAAPKGGSPATLGLSVMPVSGQEPDPGLKELLNNWAAQHSDHRWSVVVQSLGGNNRYAKLNPDTAYDPASIYKLQLMYPLLKKHQPEAMQGVNLAPGSLSDCVSKMLRHSDNPCGEAVGGYLGWGRSNNALKELGIKNTDLNNPAGMTTTANDTAIFLKELYSGSRFSQAEKDYVLGMMRSQTLRKGIPAGCGGCIVANKTADTGLVRHDAAIVEFSKGAYIITVFTDGASYSQIAQLTSQIHRYLSKNY